MVFRSKVLEFFPKKKKNKYNAQTVVCAEGMFHSQKEYARYMELRLMEKHGHIRELRRQYPFKLLPAQRDEETGKIIERETNYVADFTYRDKAGNLHVEDVKGYRKGAAYQLFAIKRKLMLFVHGIKVEEI